VIALRNVGFITSDEHHTIERDTPNASPNGMTAPRRNSGTHT